MFEVRLVIVQIVNMAAQGLVEFMVSQVCRVLLALARAVACFAVP